MSEEISIDRLMRFILELRQGGVTDAQVLSAMERTARLHFAPAQFAAFALEDRALPLGDGQQMSKPLTVGRMLAALELKGGETVLEVGSGSGYQAAVLGAVARRVISLERRQGPRRTRARQDRRTARDARLHPLCRRRRWLAGGCAV